MVWDRVVKWDLTQPQATAGAGILAVVAAAIAYRGVRQQVRTQIEVARSQHTLEKAYEQVTELNESLGVFVRTPGVLDSAIAQSTVGITNLVTWPALANRLEMQAFLLRGLGMDASHASIVSFANLLRSYAATPASYDRDAAAQAARAAIETSIEDLRAVGR